MFFQDSHKSALVHPRSRGSPAPSRLRARPGLGDAPAGRGRGSEGLRTLPEAPPGHLPRGETFGEGIPTVGKGKAACGSLKINPKPHQKYRKRRRETAATQLSLERRGKFPPRSPGPPNQEHPGPEPRAGEGPGGHKGDGTGGKRQRVPAPRGPQRPGQPPRAGTPGGTRGSECGAEQPRADPPNPPSRAGHSPPPPLPPPPAAPEASRGLRLPRCAERHPPHPPPPHPQPHPAPGLRVSPRSHLPAGISPGAPGQEPGMGLGSGSAAARDAPTAAAGPFPLL